MSLKQQRMKIWDFPTRFFHWAMLSLLVTLWWTANEGEMTWHQYAAYSLMILIVTRIIWGFIGSDTARFNHFILSPRRVVEYIKLIKQSGVKPHVGHNPLGGYMVIALLVVLTLQLACGLFATDEIFSEGPFVAYVSSEFASAATWLHKKNFDLLLVLASVHIFAVLVHQWRGDKLILPMIHGYKVIHSARETSLIFVSTWRWLIVALFVSSIVGYVLIYPLTLAF
ncbi:cytochrome b/b6 domain-containing protein [Shewanella gelidii]|uniref:Cytochrome b561 n=1 Tax=Shewanella gelidii TaxID=1642821 RepID=A0A917N818_9GAMM|nr:cytochrome b/b6 domain-containing protein [Shewanella gelidii]MCL1096644.1 cytochrome b/b6 domain-containing protein [Shewanella gelidii]GGI69127.1 cytochrome b561 [Shewanella gelidii]